MGGELGGILALHRGDAACKTSGIVDPHVITEDVGAFRQVGDEETRRGVAVFAVETDAKKSERGVVLPARSRRGGHQLLSHSLYRGQP